MFICGFLRLGWEVSLLLLVFQIIILSCCMQHETTTVTCHSGGEVVAAFAVSLVSRRTIVSINDLARSEGCIH